MKYVGVLGRESMQILFLIELLVIDNFICRFFYIESFSSSYIEFPKINLMH